MEFISQATCTSPVMYLTCPPKFCTTFVLHFSWVLQPSQEKLKIILMQIFFGGGGGKGQTKCIMGDVQVAYAYSLHPGPKSAGKRKSAGHYGMMSSSHKAGRLRNKQLKLQTLFPQNAFPHRFPHNWMQNFVVLEQGRALLSFNSFTRL